MKNNKLIYPIKFIPILKEKVWGGTKLRKLFNKNTNSENVGESWEISGVASNVSIVQNGVLQGKPLTQLIQEFNSTLVGERVYNTFGNTFPLLFKFIDAKEDLSVQLHPSDELAKNRHNSFGKNEMWYILNSEKQGKLVVGFNQDMNKTLYKKHLQENTLSEILHFENVKKGDTYFIETGIVHAIGAGVVLAEIQQTSDVTYRIYDYNRPGIDGKLRELHTDLALKAINFKPVKFKLSSENKLNSPVQLCKTKYFQTNKIEITKKINRDLKNIDSFVVYMCVEGEGLIIINDNSEEFKKGDTLLIPAQIDFIEIISINATILEVYIP
ncbi:MAG: class I mannose-6-phosphate isomerase [Flavobacteriaceae bacterium]|nr:class I mannose-6-phosphate isomerase [Flavobacteriaceae bacterium]